METAHLIISGKVQGVFYRASAKKVARQLEITGWIKNIKGGQVEALITGAPASVKKFIDWAGTGPDKAEVGHVEVESRKVVPFEDFTIQRS